MLQDANLYRVALAQADLSRGYFIQLGIPRPTNCVWRDYSSLAGQSTGFQAKQGYNNITLSWDRLTRFHVYLLESYQRQVTPTTLIYLTVDRTDGLNPGPSWYDISGKPHVITYTPESNVRDKVLTGVVWFVTNITTLGAAF